MLRERPLRQGAAGSLLNTATTSSVTTLATLYLQDARGYSPLAAGLMLLPFSLAVVGGSALAAPALARWRPQRVVAAGLALIAAGIIDTAAQLGTALGVAVLLLVAALTTGIPGPGRPVPAVAWSLAAGISLAGAVLFARRDRLAAMAARRRSRSANDLQK